MTVRCHLLGGMLVLCSVAAACAAAGPLRQTVSLDGEWDVAEGAMDAVPAGGGMKPGGEGLTR